MSVKVNIKDEKTELRMLYRDMRRSMTYSQKYDMDKAIFTTIVSLKQYVLADTILTYVSNDLEVDTLILIKHALANKKRVAVPRCIPGTHEMEFYKINSLDDLEIGSYNLLEPNINKCERIVDYYNNTMCIVPGFSFDMRGYRLGYGMGFYDRFLKDFDGISVGLCYYDFMKMVLPCGKRDINVKMLVTEKFVSRFL